MGTMPPAVSHEGFTTRRNPGRRADDLEGLLKNRWARRIAFVMLPIVGWLGNELKDWYLSVPSIGWQSQVSASVEEQQKLRNEFVELKGKVAVVAARVDENAARAEADRQEIKGELTTLNDKLDRWFERAAAAKSVR